MPEHNIILPSKPKAVSEDGPTGIYEIDGLYPGYGHTLGNSLRRIILSSLPGASITNVRFEGVPHEFTVIPGVKEDVTTILLNLKKVRFRMLVDDPQDVTIAIKGARNITAKDIETPGQVEVLNAEQYIASTTDKGAAFKAELRVEKGLGYIPRETHQEAKVPIGTIAVDAVFTPIRRVNYEVENMRVGDRTDYNRLRIFIETDGSLTPREALERSIEVMINQLSAIIGFRSDEPKWNAASAEGGAGGDGELASAPEDTEFLKTRVDSLGLSSRTANALSNASIRTVGGLVRKNETDLLAIEGLGEKGLKEIRRALSNFGMTLKSD
ncbi:DNA-directed RNA polymerase subunit alpha [bacterium]|nr:DNA-directed RNA polymerase subunit alpha [bacterium]MCI0565710.1 DNA-directed RNA polymerase subunit alpha [bacterium]MCI0679977.1 DNA-directed RNA polymerase subunit alpha [bacterium]